MANVKLEILAVILFLQKNWGFNYFGLLTQPVSGIVVICLGKLHNPQMHSRRPHETA